MSLDGLTFDRLRFDLAMIDCFNQSSARSPTLARFKIHANPVIREPCYGYGLKFIKKAILYDKNNCEENYR